MIKRVRSRLSLRPNRILPPNEDLAHDSPNPSQLPEPPGGLLRLFARTIVLVAAFVAVPVLPDLAERNGGIAFLGILASGAAIALAFWLVGRFAEDADGVWGLWIARRQTRVCIVSALVASFVALGVAWAIGGRGGLVYLLAASGLLLFFLVAAVELLVRFVARVRPSRDPARRFIRLLVEVETGASLFALPVLLIGAVFIAGDQVDGVTEVTSSGERVKPGSATRSLLDATDIQILVGLEPVLSYGAKDTSLPIRVDEYLQESEVRVVGPIESGSATADLSSPPKCRDETEPCLLVENKQCPGGRACAPFELLDEIPALAIDERIVTYGRVLRKGRDAIAGWSSSPFGDKLIGIAQWWYFTPIDDWRDQFLAGLGSAHKRHPADWEQITIGFDDKQPLFAAFSSHCGGRWRAWQEVRILNSGFAPMDVLGSLLHVRAERTDGSHGFYFDAYARQSPELAGCLEPVVRHLVRGHLMVAGVDDATADLGYALPKVIDGPEARAALAFPAWWSVGTNTTARVAGNLVLSRADGTVGAPAGPDSPVFKPSFQEPLRTIFCSPKTWNRDAERYRLPRARCP